MDINNNDLEEFERKTNLVQQLITGLANGTIKPEDVKIPGEKTEKEKEDERIKEEQRVKLEKKQKLEEKQKECEKWWQKAEILKGITRKQAMKQLNINFSIKNLENEDQIKEIVDDDGNVLFPKPKVKVDAIDYSVWDKWVPDDPVSLEEMHKIKEKHDKKQNDAFEKANPEFCKQFREDQEKRENSLLKKQRDVEKLKVRGNRYFVRKEYEKAIKEYMNALNLIPWNSTILTNLAQVYVKLKDWDQVMEFSERALFIDPRNVKAYWRRSRFFLERKDFINAKNDLQIACYLDPENKHLKSSLEICKEEILEAEAEQRIQKALKKSKIQNKENQIENFSSLNAKLESLFKNSQNTLDVVQRIIDLIISCKNKNELSIQTKLRINLSLQALETILETDKDIFVLIRTSNVLEILYNWWINDFEDEIQENIVKIIARCCQNKRNAEFLNTKKIIIYCIETFSDIDKLKSSLQILEQFSHHSFASIELCENKLILKQITRKEIISSNPKSSLQILWNISSTKQGKDSLIDIIEPKDIINLLIPYTFVNYSSEQTLGLLANLVQHHILQDYVAKYPKKLVNRMINIISSNQNDYKISTTMKSYALIVLINTSLERSGQVCLAIYNENHKNGLKLLLNLIKDTIYTNRVITILSQCLNVNKIAKDFCSMDENVIKVFKALQQSESDYDSLSQFIRCCAIIIDTRKANISFIYPYLKTLANILEQTTIKSQKKRNNILCANILKCFIPLASIEDIQNNEIIHNKVIPYTIKLLTSSDYESIRKNASILIAKLAISSQENMKIIRDLRGMEIIQSIGHQYIT